MDLNDSRAEIDRIDAGLVELLKKRFKWAREIGMEKSLRQMEIEDRLRDKEVLKNYKRLAEDELDEGFIEELVELILRYSKEVQRK